MSVGDVLRIARARMEDPAKIARGAFTAALDGAPWTGDPSKAPCMCPLSHFEAAAGWDPGRSAPVKLAFWRAVLVLSGIPLDDDNHSMIANWWDGGRRAFGLVEPTHDNLLAAIDRAIASDRSSSELLV